MRVNYKGSKIEDFRSFIEDMGLIDMPSIDGKLTWFTWKILIVCEYGIHVEDNKGNGWSKGTYMIIVPFG